MMYVDFILYEILYHYTSFDANYLAPYEGLCAYKRRFEEIPTIKSYMASPDYIKGPCINPMAKRPF